MSSQAIHQHTLFLSPERALAAAQQAYTVQHKLLKIVVPQLCYYCTLPVLADGPETLIYVPLDQIANFFSTTRLHTPTKLDVVADAAMKDAEQHARLQHTVVSQLQEASRRIATFNVESNTLTARLAPDPIHHEPLRVFAKANRYEKVVQTSIRGMLTTLARHGCQTKLVIEADDHEHLEPHHIAQEYLDFNPHIVIEINNAYADQLHPDVFHISWWQDYWEEYFERTTGRWRPRSFAFSIAQIFDPLLKQTGCPSVRRQPFCIDTQVFCPQPDIKREDKIVFIGSSYSTKLIHGGLDQLLLELMVPKFLKGEPITTAFLHTISEEFDVDYHYVFWHMFHYIVRQLSVRWICEQSVIPCEVYGRGWEADSVVAPFFKGEIEHGPEIAKLYNQAKYALVAHPFEIMSQRLAEAGACGAIPIVYNCRWSATKPHWEEECLLYKTKQQLLTLLTTEKPTYPERFMEYFSFDHFAARILTLVRNKAKGSEEEFPTIQTPP